MTSGIYKITNTVNGKFYIGSSQDIERRWRDHRSALNHNKHHTAHLQSAWNKYGEESFSFAIIFRCQPDELLDYEQAYFSELKPQYNHGFVAGSSLGIKRSEASKLKLSLAHIGKPSGRKGKPLSEETRAKLSKAHKGKKITFTDAHRENLSKAGMGHTISEETRAKMIASHIGKTPWNKGLKKNNENQ
jgi:group I intron endonuclease